MSSVVDFATREERPPYVRFERRPVEDHAKSKAEGRWVGRDVDFVKITPSYTKDVIVRDVDGWFSKLKQDEKNGRIPNTWLPHYQRSYDAWKNGQEIPLEGTPIRGWGVISPALQETLLSCDIRTVEDAAQMTEDAMRRVGMAGNDIRNKARAALKAGDKGKLVMENAELRAKLTVAEQNVEKLTADLQMLKDFVKANVQVTEPAAAQAITATDLIDTEPQPKKGK